MAKKAWYENYIGYCFSDGGVLMNIISSKKSGNIYVMFYERSNDTINMTFADFKKIAWSTNLPR